MNKKGLFALIGAAIGFVVVLIYVLIVSKGEFESFFFLLLAIPASGVGALLGMALTKKDAPKDTPSQQQTGTLQNTVADDLLNLKKLLDAGVLTQEEYEAKKKTLMEKL